MVPYGMGGTWGIAVLSWRNVNNVLEYTAIYKYMKSRRANESEDMYARWE